MRVSSGVMDFFFTLVVKNQRGKNYVGGKKYDTSNNDKFLSISIIFETYLDKTLGLIIYLFI